jgi:hypothetical protein
VANFHLVSGYNAQHEHAYNRIIQPFGVVLLAGLLAQWPAAAELLRQVAARRVFAAAGVVVICAAGVRQSCVADSVLPFHDRSHCANRLAFDLATNLEDEQVVAILDEPARALLPTVTKHWSFVPIGFRTIADNREVLTRFVITAKLGSVSEADALALLRSPSPGPYLRSYAYGLLDDAELSPAAEALFHQLWQTVSLEAALASRRLDLVVLPEEAQPAKVSGMDIVPVRSFGSWTVYRLQRA